MWSVGRCQCMSSQAFKANINAHDMVIAQSAAPIWMDVFVFILLFASSNSHAILQTCCVDCEEGY